MPWRERVCRTLVLCLMLGLAVALVLSVAFGYRWLREPTYQQRINALGDEYKALSRREDELEVHHAPVFEPEEFDRITRQLRKNQLETRAVYEEAARRYREDPWYRRLEPVREDLRRRLGW